MYHMKMEKIITKKLMTHKLIKIKDYLLVVDDSEIKEGDWFLHKTHTDETVDKCANRPSILDVIGTEFNYYSGYCEKIIAHLPLNNSPILEGVDLLPPLEQDDEVEKFAKKEANNDSHNHIKLDYQDGIYWGFFKGYNKAKEKYKYTEDDLREAFDCGRYSQDHEFSVKNLIQSLSQPKLPVAFKCDIEFVPVNHASGLQPTGHQLMDESILQNYKIKTTINSQGQTKWVGKYIYKNK